ncbi:N-acyl-D-amino-acid deacylase family protein [Sporomusa sphaeroides]|uniref:N-acyl-D-glutamate deacylase n=1 Tax=Sporomusa sphaeroides DSM 2875 TaxID=1337886 RepID=A0ABM9W8J5_9FIRM|nr:D-aminoacylase [Sporomusa sphaeroides]OLS55294.1 N-acyl-D-glutamate deacylase [Sporomusa sphaeroides DSM 2875]CVK20307.1 N-acyl-D-glutamate deacylase [Sporomusa sphaeroides DSM 2875]HML33057.1 D-aminoacylase [Sporomusa sphaeroides]
MRILIKNGMVVDGTGAKAFAASVAIEGEKITAIGQIPEQPGDKVIDAAGLVVAPGFIDTHSHSDLKVLVDPYVEPKIRQGVTTEVLGQDGISMAPLPKQYISPWRKNLAGLDGDSDDIDWTYETTAGYLALMERQGVGLNQSYLVPHGNIRMEAIGLGNCQPNAEEVKTMCAITRREMEAGAYGLSTGLIYMPCAYSETQEIIEMCKVVAEYDGVFVVHQRSEADTILTSMEEVIEVGRQSGVKIHFSHFKVCGKKNWQYIDQVIELLEQAQAEGIRVSFDQYPYVAGSTMLGVILPPWVHDGGTDKLLERLQDAELRQKMIYDMEHGIPGWDNFVDFAGLDQIFVTSVKTAANQDLVGKNLVEIGKIRGKDPYQATFDLLYQEENAVGMVDFYGKEEHVIRFLTRPEQNVCTDGLLAGKPHPRVFGSFPRVLGKYVREEQALPLEAAIHKMTAKPAEVFGFTGRGRLMADYYADIVVFNPETVNDQGTYIDPVQYPVGIEHVLINGKQVIENGQYHKVLAGKVLRK